MECGPCVEVKFPQLLNLPLLPGEYLAGAEGHGIFEGRLWTKPRDKGVYLEKIRMQNCDNLRSRWRELKKKKKKKNPTDCTPYLGTNAFCDSQNLSLPVFFTLEK